MLSSVSVRAGLLSSVFLLPFSHVVQAQETQPSEEIELDPIIVLLVENTGTDIVPDSDANTGQITLGEDALATRGDVSGDPNTALATLPNVQTATVRSPGGTINDDAGENIDDILNIQPLEISISGAKVNENNFMIDGVGINSAHAGNGSASDQLSRESESQPTFLDDFFGLHSQTIFVPESMVEEVELYDSNVSAQYGGFQGGVVNYRLREPGFDAASGSFSLGYTGSPLTDFVLITPDGENTADVSQPEFHKVTASADYSFPVSEDTAFIVGLSTTQAWGDKERSPQYSEGAATSRSYSNFLRAGIRQRMENGDTATIDLRFSDYDQGRDFAETRDTRVDITNQTLQGQCEIPELP